MASERVVKVVLTAQMQNYLAGMEKARKVTADAASEADKLARTKEQFDRLGRASLAAGGLIAVGLGVAVAKFAEFDQAMSNVAATGDDARNNLEALSEAAIDAGASTVFSASEAAGAIENLAKAGLSSADILGGALTGALDLAAAGGLAVADAAEIAATTMQQFGLEGEDATHVADLLAAGAGKAMGDVADMAQALKQSGLVAKQFGISVEETTGTLAAFASAGLLGSDAGTSFRTMLLRLANPTGEVRDLMKQLGIEAYDAQGQFIGLEGLAGELEVALAGMTQEQKNATLATIFGQDAIRAATVLYEEGAEGIADWTEKVDDAGYASETAATRLDNLKGDIEALQGAVDSAFISMGEAADGPLRGLVQGLTGLVDKFNEMPDAAKQAVFWVGSLAAVGATALGAYLLLVPKMAEFNAALEILGPRAQTGARWVGTLAKVGGGALVGVTAGAAAIDALTQALAALGPSAEETANQVKTARDAVALFDAAIQDAGQGSNVRLAEEQIRSLGDTLDAFKEGANGQGGIVAANTIVNIQRLGAELAKLADEDLEAAQRQFRNLAEGANLSDEQARTLLDTMPELKNALTEQATAAGDAATEQQLLDLAMGDSKATTEENESALRSLAGQAEATGEEVEGLADQIRNFGDVSISVKEAQSQLQQAVDDLTESVSANGATLDLNEQAGRDNQAALIDLAEASKELAASTYEQTGSQEEANKVIADGRQRLIEALEQFGLTGDAAEAYADELGLIPENITTYIEANTQGAITTIEDFINRYGTLQGVINYRAVQSVETGVERPGRASGGAIYGPGTGTSDTAGLYRLSNGEHVWTAEEVRRAGGHGAMYAMRDAILSGRGLGGEEPARGGDSYAFYGTYAPTAAELFREAETLKRRALSVAGV